MTELTRQAWDALERGEGEQASGLLVRRVAPDSVHDVRVGIDLADGTRLVLFAVPPESLLGIDALPSARGFVTHTVRGREQNRPRATIRISATHRTYADLFAHLADDILAKVLATGTAAEAVAALRNRLSGWQAFMRTCGPDGLSREASRGLFGELTVLQQVFAPTIGFGMAVRCWVGPHGAPHDFHGSGWAAEVKTVQAPDAVVHISSETQLDEAGVGKLLLVAVRLSETRTGGSSLPELIASLRSAMATDAETSLAFDELLFRAGYLDEHSEQYREPHWRPVAILFFDVRDGFPRLVKADLRQGVQFVSYQVDLALCSPFEIPASEAQRHLKSAAGEHV